MTEQLEATRTQICNLLAVEVTVLTALTVLTVATPQTNHFRVTYSELNREVRARQNFQRELILKITSGARSNFKVSRAKTAIAEINLKIALFMSAL